MIRFQRLELGCTAATLTHWRSVGGASARADPKNFVPRGMGEFCPGENFLNQGETFTLAGAGGNAP